MSSSNQRPGKRGCCSVLRCAISHYRQFPCLFAPGPNGCVATLSDGGRRTEAGTAGGVRNGFLLERELQTGVGPVTVRIPTARRSPDQKPPLNGIF